MAPCPAALIDPASLSLIAKEIVGVSKDSFKALEGYHLVIGQASYLTEAATHHLKEAKRGLDEANFRAQ